MKTNPFYEEILVLDAKLRCSRIPHHIRQLYNGWQILYPTAEREDIVCSVIEHYGSHGASVDRVEIQGLLQPGETDVQGWLTADEAYQRIKAHWMEVQNGRTGSGA